MKFKVLSLFPEMINSFKNHSIIKRAIENNKLAIDVIDFRDYAANKHHKVDDTPYGGGSGMVLQVQPIYDALQAHKSSKSKVILVCPTGKQFKQEHAHELAKETELIFICGHYEGYDERIRDYVDYEYSIGDYVITSGEIASIVMMDAIGRLVTGVIEEESHQDDSFQNGLLEYPQYTKPQVFDNKAVPEVLVNGHHKKINEYRMQESIKKTAKNRPDLLENDALSPEIKALIKQLKRDKVI
ncbi:tRNA (guanosine(37)-N1)-methyltransferase TrmD [Erysipelotrichaceae bacterium OttesenSCG-928-M19]|nr:tRNA (guanosine(37)-N1)-methyltransferase TrmD [Erysipelotrichaceae bacterium OttesenSCG-928-M19]